MVGNSWSTGGGGGGVVLQLLVEVYRSGLLCRRSMTYGVFCILYFLIAVINQHAKLKSRTWYCTAVLLL